MTAAAHARNNVVRFPPRPAKALPPSEAGPFTYAVLARTDIIGGDYMGRQYRHELVIVDPDAELVDNCIIVFQFTGGMPHVARWWRSGRDHHGRFVPKGDPREAFYLDNGFAYCVLDPPRIYRVLGRYVGEPRVFNRECNRPPPAA